LRHVASKIRLIAFAGLLVSSAAGLIAPGAQAANLNDTLRESSPGSEGEKNLTEESSKAKQKPTGFLVSETEITDRTEILRSLAPIKFLPEHSSGSKRSIDLDVHFELNSAILTPIALHQLDELGAALTSEELAAARFEIAGHTDATGSDAYNQGLSERRVTAVHKYLVEIHSVDSTRIKAMGYGEARLKDPLNPNSGVNRRVEVAVIYLPANEQLQELADELEEERAIFGRIAAELVTQLHANFPTISESSSLGLRKIAIAPFRDEELPLVPVKGREFNDHLAFGLNKITNKRFRIMSRDSLKALIENMIETGRMDSADNDAISAILDSNQVDALIVGRIERIGDELTLSYEAVNTNSQTLAQAMPRRLPWRSEYGRNLDARMKDAAVQDAVRKLAKSAGELRILRLGGIRYEASGELTEFSFYLEDGLSVAFKTHYANALSGKKIRVERVELSTDQLNAMRSIELSEKDLRDENLGAKDGAYTLTGTYWVQGAVIEVHLSLTAPGGGSIGWKGGVLASDIGNVVMRPKGDFGVWRRKDGMGPVKFTLTTDNGRDPVYRVGEKMNLLIQTDRDVWLHCYYLQQNGKVFQIFPNPFQKEAKIEGGRLYTIPGQRFPFEFNIMPPAGKELVKCFALSSDVADQLPPEFAQDEFAPLPPAMKHELPNLFRALAGVAMNEASTVINVVE